MTHIRIAKRAARGFTLDVDFPVGAGVTAIFGHDGAGKTLLLEAIAGFTRPDSGRVMLDDVILYDGASHVSLPPRHRRCAFVSQEDSLFPHMTVRQNLVFAAHRWPRLERHRRVTEILDKFQLSADAGLRPRYLDDARRLRGAAARALIAEPKLLLLDEREMGEELLLLIKSVAAGPVLFATGDLDLCCAAADHMVVLDGGRMLQQGAPRTVLQQPASAEAARLLGIPNLFQATIAALDPGRNNSRLDFEHFTLTGPYVPGHFKGDRVWVAAAAEDLRVHGGNIGSVVNAVPVELARASQRANSVMLEFAGGISVAVSREAWARQADNQGWQVEFPVEALRVL